MKGILKRVAGAFVEVEDSPTPKPVTPPKTSTVRQAVQPVYNVLSDDAQQFRAQFASILEEENRRNHPGNDYYEFIVMKNAMTAIPQENIRYEAAFAGWRTGGNQTKKTLLDTAQIYLGLVEKEIKEFEEAYKAEYSQQVVKNEQLIDQKTKEVQSLVEKMNLLNSEIQSLKQENLNNTVTLTSKHDAFMAAGESQRREIMDEMDKINHYIN